MKSVMFAFLALGLIGIGVCVRELIEVHRFAATARRAEGVVTKVEWRATRDDAGHIAHTYYPWVRFRAGKGAVEFPGSAGSSQPVFSVGDRVTVLYPPERPEQARIGSLSEQYLGPLIFGGLGLIFATTGGGFLLASALRWRRRRRALALGTPVQATVIEVRQDTRLTFNGQSPWVIVAEYHDDRLGEAHAFISHWLWDNPLDRHPIGSEVMVYYLLEEPRVYAVQID
jgi:Protein of unknown function (DUF3592)